MFVEPVVGSGKWSLKDENEYENDGNIKLEHNKLVQSQFKEANKSIHNYRNSFCSRWLKFLLPSVEFIENYDRNANLTVKLFN